MYDVGFGDCFLVRIPTAEGTRKILFDCGTVAQGTKPMDQVLRQLWLDCRDEGGDASIDVVVATHRHKDHVSGFSKAEWEHIHVREVWMPWTEHPTDPLARRIREAQARLAVALNASADARLAVSQTDEAASRWRELALNALSNERAMTTLHEGFGGRPKRRFLPAQDQDGLAIESDVLPGVGVFVLGPSRDPEVIRDMDPPVGKSYLQLKGPNAPAEGQAPDPFDLGWRLDVEAGWSGPRLMPGEEEELAKIGELDQAVAVSLDKAVNGTSLMIVLKVGDTHLLFPGDAQWGTWQTALRDPDARKLLQRTRFYKVGHHGSHNATPVQFVEEVMAADGVLSMVSTKTVANWPLIPKDELLTALGTRKVKLARSDQRQMADPEVFKVGQDIFVDLIIPVGGQ